MKRVIGLLGIGIALSVWTPVHADDFDDPPKDLAYGNRWALVVGINYDDAPAVQDKAIPRLRNAEEDAKAVAQVLEKRYGFQVKLLLGKDATRDAIYKHLGDDYLGKDESVTNRDCAVVYFACHGDRRGAANKGEYIGLLYPFDVRFSNGKVEKDSCVRVNEMKSRILEECHARHKFLVLDSCYSGQVFGSGTRAARDAGASLSVRAFKESVFWGLASARADQEAQDGRKQSPFNEVLVSLLNEAAEAESRAPLSCTRLIADLEVRLGEKLRDKNQDPLGQKIDGTGELYFMPVSGDRPPPPPSASLVASLTGLHGRWWFQETPWLVPVVRDELARQGELINLYDLATRNGSQAAKAGSDRLSGNARAIYADVEGHFSNLVRDKKVEQPSYLLVLRTLNVDAGPKEAHETLIRATKELQTGLKASRSPAALHALAVIQHRMGNAAEAMAAYDEAEKAYLARHAAAGDKVECDEALALCLDDRGRLRTELAGQPELAPGDFLRARSFSKNPYLLIDSLCNESDSLRAVHRPDEAEERLDDALRIAAKALARDHPLLAYIHERKAWVHMERWQLDKALVEFQQAVALWSQNKSHDPACEIYALDDQHGIAMAQRFLGYPDKTLTTFRTLLAETERLINERKTAAYLPLLHLRRANSLERKADCELFTTTPRLESAADDLETAVDEADSSPATMRPRQKAKILLKWAIAQALTDGQADEAVRTLARVDDIAPEARKDLAVLESVARIEVALGLKRPGTDPQADLRKAVLDCLHDRDRRVDRDTLEVLLFVSRQLLDSDAKGAKSCEPDVEAMFKLASIALERSGEDDDIHPFLRDFLDIAIDRYAESRFRPRRLCEYIAKANLGDSVLSLPEDRAILAFHFPRSGGKGFAVVWEQDNVSQIVPLELGLEAIMARAGGKTQPLPDGLTKVLSKTTKPVQVYWADHVLGSEDRSFPFDKGPFDLRFPGVRPGEGRNGGD